MPAGSTRTVIAFVPGALTIDGKSTVNVSVAPAAIVFVAIWPPFERIVIFTGVSVVAIVALTVPGWIAVNLKKSTSVCEQNRPRSGVALARTVAVSGVSFGSFESAQVTTPTAALATRT